MKHSVFKKYGSLYMAVLLLTLSLNGCSSDTNGQSGSPSSDNESQTSSAPQSVAKGKEGLYIASAKGYGGEITVNVTIAKDGSIDEVDASCSNETESIGQKAAPKICAAVLKNQSLAVDTVSGATVTSKAVLSGIEKALTEAGADVNALKTNKSTQ